MVDNVSENISLVFLGHFSTDTCQYQNICHTLTLADGRKVFFGMFCGHVVWAGSQQNSFPGVRPCFNTTEVHVFNKVFNGNLSHYILSIKRLIVCVLVNVFKPNWASLHQFMVQMFKRNVKHLN